MKKYNNLLFVILVCFLSCKIKPIPINYGKEECHFCKMTIVDKRHGSEAVTRKGKIYKFDAIECMIRYLADKDEKNYMFLLVNNYQNPGEFINATKSTYLQSQAIPSPMGAYLSALNDKKEAQILQNKNGGKIFDWLGIKKHLTMEIIP